MVALNHTATRENPLPGPEARPGADVVLYDGHCNFCRSGIERLRWWDPRGRLAYLSLHDPRVAERWPDLPHDRLMREMCVVDPEGRRHWGPDAVRHLSRRLRRLWWLAALMHLPGAMLLARPAYRWVAKNRYRFLGKSEACESGSCSLHR